MTTREWESSNGTGSGPWLVIVLFLVIFVSLIVVCGIDFTAGVFNIPPESQEKLFFWRK